jgi:hypothetical protein
MATTTTNFGWDIPQSTDLVKDGATAIAALGQDIDTALVDLKGGTTGQVLAKASGTDLDFSWVAQDDSNAIQNTQLTGKGALISAFSAGTPATLSVGTNNQVLVADSSTATGLKWATPAGGGKVLQVVQSTYSTQTLLFSTTYTDNGMTVSITPSASTSKVLILFSVAFYIANGARADNAGSLKLVRNSTDILDLNNVAGVNFSSVNGGGIQYPVSYDYLDSPATTSAITYKLQQKVQDIAGFVGTAIGSNTCTFTAIEIGA